jgi:hypothetical protein
MKCGCCYFLKYFSLKKHQNIIIFYVLKIIFNISALKLFKNIKKYINLKQKKKNNKKLNFYKNTFKIQNQLYFNSPTVSYRSYRMNLDIFHLL